LGKAAGDEVRRESEERLETAARSERSRIERDAEEQGKRAQRRAESAAVDLTLFIAESWLRDLHRASLGAGDLIANTRRRAEVTELSRSTTPARVRSAIDMIGRTRRALRLNVTRELALESLAHRLDGVLP
jgi:DNA polymerase-3 subunit delta'